jgi:DNA invertase Pin-like site-specific DNA recombinase
MSRRPVEGPSSSDRVLAQPSRVDANNKSPRGRSKRQVKQTIASAVASILKPAYSYARFSDKKQKQVSIEDQERICDELAAAHGAFIPPENRFCDRAIRGSGLREDRPGWNALCKLIEAGAVHILIADEHSRLFRSNREAFEIKEQILKHKMTVISRSVDTSNDDSWEFMWDVHSALSVEEIRRLGGRIKRAQKGLVATGKATGPPPYGYKRKVVYNDKGDRDHTLYEIDPVTSPIVQRIFAERKRGTSYDAICRGLIADGIPGPSGAPLWLPGNVPAIVRRPLYKGVHIFGEYTNLQPHLALVTTDDWHLVQAKSKAISSTGRGGGKHWAAGLVKCGDCGGTTFVHGKKGCSPHVMCGHCLHVRRSEERPRTVRSCNVRVVEAALRLGVQLILTPERVAGYRESIVRAGERTSEGELEALNAKIASVDRRLKHMADFISALDDEAAAKPFQDQACTLRDQRSALALAVLRLGSSYERITKADINKQLKVDPRKLVPKLFDGKLPAHELRSLLSRLFPLIVIELHDDSEVLINLTISPGALFSTSGDAATVNLPQQSYRVRIVPHYSRKPPKLVELVCQTDAPDLPERLHHSHPSVRSTRKRALASWRQSEASQASIQ